MFEKGSYVIYRSEGVCLISDIRDEKFASVGKADKYYILTPINDRRSTVFIPADNERLLGLMRKLMSADEINKMVEELRDERIEWQSDSRARNNLFRDILSRGDRRELVVLANTVGAKAEELTESGKRVCIADINTLRRAERLLFEEFSATTDISSAEQIMPLLRGELTLKPRAEK